MNKKSEIWSFQETAHDIWNSDLPGPPILTSVIKDNHKIDVVVATTKRANTLILDRVSGKNIFDLNYRVAEASTVPGEKTSLYQLDLKIPEPFGKNVFNKNDITNISDESADYINSIVKDSKFGFFKPVSLKHRIKFYRLYENGESFGEDGSTLGDLIRNKFTIKYKSGKKINPYISGELFHLLNTNNNPLDEYRASFGIEIDLPRKNSINFFYIFKKEGIANSHLNEINVIGLNYISKI